jgi:mannose-6-phosphate isomerase-like protein (cupin superfamily)
VSLIVTPHQHVTVMCSTLEVLELDATWGPHGRRPPKQFHPAQEERFEVVSGCLRAHVDGVERRYGAGEAFAIPPGAVHGVWNDGDDEARAVWRTLPALRTLDLLESIDGLYRDGRIEPGRMPGLLVWATLLTEYRDVLRLAAGPALVVRGVFAALARLGRLRGYGQRVTRRRRKRPPLRAS